MKTFLIADSGGTKTNWCFVNVKKEKRFFSTQSFHPSQWSDEFKNQFHEFWKSENVPFDTTVTFYGAGCSTISNKEQLISYFRFWGFLNVTVESDLVAAGKALYDKEKGFVAILGTGSVVFEYNNGNVSNQIGGLGYLIGDEGSGYYFGHLFLNNLLNDNFDLELSENVYSKIGTREAILKKVYGKDGKLFISSIALLLGDLNKLDPIQDIHIENVQLFVLKHLISKDINSIAIVGSYGYYFQNLIFEVLSFHQIDLIDTVQYPIEELTDCLLRDAF